MSTRKESERTKFIQEKCQTLLTQMLRDEDNKYCVDCDAKGPRWASWNLGVFLCIRCAGIHRNLGVHISRVKSVNLDSWTPEQVVSLQQMGNSRARAVYEAQLPDGFRRPQTDSALESFIRAKYEHKKYMAREWVPSPPAKANWDKEVDEEMERLKRKKKSSSSASLGIATPANEKKSTLTVKTPIPAPLPKPKASSSPKTSRIVADASAGSQDLLGLSSPTSTNGPTIKPTSGDTSGTDVFTNFLSAPPSKDDNATKVATATTVSSGGNADMSLAKEEQDFFNQVVPNEKEKAKMTKDSILALYGTTPNANTNLGQFNGTTFSGTHVAGGFNQFGSPMPAYSLPPQMHMSTGGMAGVSYGGSGTAAAVGLSMNASASPNYVTAAPVVQTSSPNMFGAQMMSGGFGQPLTAHPQNTFATFPPPQMQAPVAAAYSSPQAFVQPTPASNGNINQQFANLNLGNVWQ